MTQVTERAKAAGFVPYSAAAATVAVLRGARTLREIAEACGWTSVATARSAVILAEREGLLAWGDGSGNSRAGTLHARVRVIQ